MANTSKMNMPLIAADQSQKHVTHNEALNIIDAFTHPSVINRTRTSPPGSPTEGDQYIIAASATGDWVGHDYEVTTYQNGAWVFFEPYIGMHAWIQDEGVDVNIHCGEHVARISGFFRCDVDVPNHRVGCVDHRVICCGART